MDTVVAAEFHPLERNQIVTCGKGHISFWTLDAGGTLYKRNGIFETTRDRPKYVTCLAFTQNGDVLSGDSNGSVVTWGRGEYDKKKWYTGFIRRVHYLWAVGLDLGISRQDGIMYEEEFTVRSRPSLSFLWISHAAFSSQVVVFTINILSRLV